MPRGSRHPHHEGILIFIILAGLAWSGAVLYYTGSDWGILPGGRSASRSPVFTADPPPRLVKAGNLPADGTYLISQASGTLPRIIEVAINPPDVEVGQRQTLSMTVADPADIVSAKAYIETDDQSVVLQLEAEPGADTFGNSWTVHDTHNKTYRTKFEVKDSAGRENSVTIAWSDACNIPKGGDWNLANYGNCTIASPDGVDNGNVTIANYTLTLNSRFAWNPGKSLNITTGAVAISSVGSLAQTYAWEQDGDSDGYGTGAITYQDTQPAGYRRRYFMQSTTDCNDGDSTAYVTTGPYYVDNDHDGTGSSYAGYICGDGNTPYGYSGSYGDCNDSDANVWGTAGTLYDDGNGNGTAAGSGNYCVGNYDVYSGCYRFFSCETCSYVYGACYGPKPTGDYCIC